MILYDFCLSAAQFCYLIVYKRKVESRVQIADRCPPWKISSGAENLVLQAPAQTAQKTSLPLLRVLSPGKQRFHRAVP
jgi:hypothetical protein